MANRSLLRHRPSANSLVATLMKGILIELALSLTAVGLIVVLASMALHP
jgi:hypothetical protein